MAVQLRGKKKYYNDRLLLLPNYIDSNSINKVIESIYYFNEEDIELKKEDPKHKPEPIKILINSSGGEVYDMFALLDVIDQSKTKINTISYGKVMSSALPIYLAGNTRISGKHTIFMYHEMSYGANDEKVQYHMQEMGIAKLLASNFDKYIVSRSKITSTLLDEIKFQRKEWYFDVNDAIKYNVVHKTI